MSGSNSSNLGAEAVQPPDSRLGAEGLTLTVHPMPRVQLEGTPVDARRRASGRIKMLLVLLACATPVIASAVLGGIGLMREGQTLSGVYQQILNFRKKEE